MYKLIDMLMDKLMDKPYLLFPPKNLGVEITNQLIVMTVLVC